MERTYEMEKIVNRLLALNNEYEIEIKHRIEVQNQLKEREMALEKSLKKEKELGELKSRFVSMASHEFRTPLSTILSSVSLIGRYTETEQQDNRDKHINKIKTSVSHMTDILNDFLSVNKLEEGKVNASNENFDIILLGKSIIDELKSIAPQGLEFRFISTKENLEIFSDKKIVKNIMINLIANAIKYSKSTGFVECEIKKEGSNLLFSVTDDGIGIPDEEQKHLFDRFFRASNAINIEGTGLGLNIVKKYLDMLKGNISFTSKLYKGTRFQVRLPLNLK